MLAVALAVGLLAVPIGGAQPRASDLAREGIRGSVRSVREEVAPLATKRNGLVEGARQLVSLAVFDGRGDQAERTRYAKGKAIERSANHHLADGSLVCERQVRSSGSVFTMVAATGDAPEPSGNGWRTDRQVVTTTFDDDGLPVETVTFDEVGRHVVACTREVFDYDASERLVSSTRYSLDTGAMVGRVRFGYAESGVRAWMEVFRGADTLERRVEYTNYSVDERGNWTRRIEAELAAGNVRERRVVYRSISYYDDEKRIGGRSDGKAIAGARCFRSTAANALAKARSEESDGMGRPGGLFLAVRAVTLENPVKRTRATLASDAADDDSPRRGDDPPTVDAR